MAVDHMLNLSGTACGRSVACEPRHVVALAKFASYHQITGATLMVRFSGVMLALMMVVAVRPAHAEKKKVQGKAPLVTGEWTGLWGAFNPAQGSALEKE